MYQFSFESHRWFPMALRKPKLAKIAAPAGTVPTETAGDTPAAAAAGPGV